MLYRATKTSTIRDTIVGFQGVSLVSAIALSVCGVHPAAEIAVLVVSALAVANVFYGNRPVTMNAHH